ncbi:energy-coupling factor transporter transmembrane protein EcfT [Arthrobacter sp. Sa2CUA1]|uniref:Energy-coupling factor transporter transmembrane protein EcfT n=1 Tax=Arthrobacter gallicola TaxID=2762225 RepID=A0ABR8UPR9_9MICC|nr:energy-coupling factor transporter transmembrane protein EcfT [Arthrobacter gallicola]MBD7994096.1 energy-coupling factor transporter transmembrane protein EcfT [Arthrobacter gallicola]
MRNRDALLGAYVAADSPVHRAPLALKSAAVVVLSVLTLAAASLPVSAAAAVLIVAAYAGARLLRQLLTPLAVMWPVLVLIAGFQVWSAGVAAAVLTAGNILICVAAARLLILTVPVPELLDGVVSLVRPLKVFGADPERFGLALALMVRSLPYLLGSAADVRASAKARGLERNLRAQAVPVVIRAVAYAQQTGEALAARGIGDAGEPEETGDPDGR